MNRVLIVAGERQTGERFQQALGQSGYQTAVVWNPMQMVEFCRQHAPDFMVVDLDLAEHGLWSAVQAVRGIGTLANIPFLGLSSTGNSQLAEKAKAAGADEVGMEDLAETMQGGDIAFDVVIATPDAMRVVGKLGTLLGPRGLMPNPKTGTVTPDIEGAVNNAKAGQMRFRTDKNGIVHGGIGKVNFESEAIKGNLVAVLADLKKAKPAASKGVYFKKVTLSTTMGPGVTIDHAALDV